MRPGLLKRSRASPRGQSHSPKEPLGAFERSFSCKYHLCKVFWDTSCQTVSLTRSPVAWTWAQALKKGRASAYASNSSHCYVTAVVSQPWARHVMSVGLSFPICQRAHISCTPSLSAEIMISDVGCPLPCQPLAQGGLFLLNEASVSESPPCQQTGTTGKTPAGVCFPGTLSV